MRAIGCFGLAALACLVAAASGCGGSGIGDPCSLDAPCEDGVCNLSGPDDPVCIDSEGDLDGDGLPNKADFCNQQAGGAFDEDGDGQGDDCDRCPVAPPEAKPDSDDDLVDSPCDPEPTTGGDQIVVFEGFNGAIPSNWLRAGTGTWEARGGAAIFTATDATTFGTLTSPLPLASRHMAVLAAYRVDRLDATATQNLAGVTAIDRRPAGVSIVSCSGRRVGPMDDLVLDSDVGASTKKFTNLFDAAGLYRIAQRIDNAQGACAMIANNESGGVAQATGGEGPTEGGLTARAVDARFEYLLVVQRPN